MSFHPDLVGARVWICDEDGIAISMGRLSGAILQKKKNAKVILLFASLRPPENESAGTNAIRSDARIL